MKRSFGNLGIVLLVVLGLVAWIKLPWWGVLAVAVLLGLWLVLFRRGRQALAVAGVGISTLPHRWGASSVIVVGIAGVVAVLVAMLSMAAGFEATLDRTGNDETAIILRPDHWWGAMLAWHVSSDVRVPATSLRDGA